MKIITEQQYFYLCALGSKYLGKKITAVYQLKELLNLTNRESRKGMTSFEASNHIDTLRSLIKEKETSLIEVSHLSYEDVNSEMERIYRLPIHKFQEQQPRLEELRERRAFLENQEQLAFTYHETLHSLEEKK